MHLNVSFREPLVGEVGELPPSSPVPSAPEPDEFFMARLPIEELATIIDQQRGVIVAGRGVDSPVAVAALADALQWPVLADPRSGCRHLPQAVCAFDSLLRHALFAADHRPTVVLHLGEPPASKVLGQWLQASGAVHVHVHTQDRTIDPLGIITERIYGQVSAVCDSLAPLVKGASGTPWLARWQHADDAAQTALSAATAAEPLTEPAVARVLSTLAVQLVVASSMPVRDVEWFGAPGTTVVHSNRGANGIDGVIATAIEVAIGTEQPTVALLGDVAFCHDQSSLTALAARQLPLTVVVIDNDGGGIFSFLPQRTSLSTERFTAWVRARSRR